MSIAIVQPEVRTSPTWQRFQQAGLWVAGMVGFGCILYAVETLLLRSERRFIENPAETMTRAIGIAHFSIAWLFLFTSPRLRSRAALTRLTCCTLFGAVFCWVFASYGADKNPILFMAFYSFFFIHEAFDEAELFRRSGEIPADTPNVEGFLRDVCVSIALLMVTLVAGAQIVRSHYFGRVPELQELPIEWLAVAWLTASVLTTAWIYRTLRLAQLSYGSLRETYVLFQPLLSVYAALTALLLVGSFLGSMGPNLVILMHGLTWLVYTHQTLRERNAPVSGVWSWLRHSPTGFLTLHLGITALALVLFALRTHVWERTGIVCDMVSKSWFPYWAIMHIATSFWRK